MRSSATRNPRANTHPPVITHPRGQYAPRGRHAPRGSAVAHGPPPSREPRLQRIRVRRRSWRASANSTEGANGVAGAGPKAPTVSSRAPIQDRRAGRRLAPQPARPQPSLCLRPPRPPRPSPPRVSTRYQPGEWGQKRSPSARGGSRTGMLGWESRDGQAVDSSLGAAWEGESAVPVSSGLPATTGTAALGAGDPQDQQQDDGADDRADDAGGVE
jgi:hypothetical protein